MFSEKKIVLLRKKNLLKFRLVKKIRDSHIIQKKSLEKVIVSCKVCVDTLTTEL